MLDSFLSNPTAQSSAPGSVSEHYAAERAAGVPEAILLPGELTVPQRWGNHELLLDWPEGIQRIPETILSPPTKNGCPQDFILSVAVRWLAILL